MHRLLRHAHRTLTAAYRVALARLYRKDNQVEIDIPDERRHPR